MDVRLLWQLCVVRQRYLCRADHSSRGVLPTEVRRCLWSKKPYEWEGPGPLRTVAPKRVKNCALLCYYVATSGNFLLKFRNNQSVPTSRSKNPKIRRQESKRYLGSWSLKMELIGYLETSVRYYYYSLRNNPLERSSQLHHGRSLKSGIIKVSSCRQEVHVFPWWAMKAQTTVDL
jgi:hypothetical protein